VTPLLRIRQEYQEPPSAVIRGYRDHGNSMRLTAACLGVQTKTLRGYCRRFGIAFDPARYRPECRPKGKGWPAGKPQNVPKRYTDAELLAAVRECGTWREMAMREGPDPTTVKRRFGSWREAKRRAWEGMV